MEERLKKLQPSKEHWVLVFCIFLGAILAFEHIGLLDFWLDEASVAIAINHPFPEVIKTSLNYSQPLLHNIGVKIWSYAFGISEWSLRSFSAFCFLLLIAAMYKAGAFFFQKKEAGLMAAFLMATNFFAIWYATQVKTYALASLIGLGSYYFFIKIAKNPNGKNYLFYLILAVIGPYAHPWLFLIFFSQIINALIFRKYFQNIFRLLFFQIFIAIFSIPFVLMTIEQGRLGVNSYLGKPDNWTFLESFSYLSFGSSWVYLMATILALVIVLRDQGFFKRIFRRYFPENNKDMSTTITPKNSDEFRMNIILSIYFLFPLLAALAVSFYQPAYAVGRYEMIVLPPFLLLLGNLWLKIREKTVLFFIAMLLIYFASQNVLADKEKVESYRSTDKTIMAKLAGEAGNGDYIIATDLSWTTADYYLNETNIAKKKINLISFPAEIEKHPAWKNTEKMLEDRDRYDKEADSLIEKIKNSQDTEKIYVLYKTDSPIYETLKNKLDNNFSFIKIDYAEIPREPSWFDYILVYKK